MYFFWWSVIFLITGKFFFVVLKWFTVTWFIVMFMIGLWDPCPEWCPGKYGWPIWGAWFEDPTPMIPLFFFFTFLFAWKIGGSKL